VDGVVSSDHCALGLWASAALPDDYAIVAMRVIYLTRPTTDPGVAVLVHDAAAALARIADVYAYGPGSPGYDPKDTIENVVNKARPVLGGAPHWIIAGHTWLSDADGTPPAECPRLELARTGGIPVAVVLHNEHAALGPKLDYVRDTGVEVAFTHHHEAEVFARRTGVPFYFWPAGVNPLRFKPGDGVKTCELGFLADLERDFDLARNGMTGQLLRELFKCVCDVPVKQARPYRALPIAWAVRPADRIGRMVARLYKQSYELDEDQRAEFVRRCRILVVPRGRADLINPLILEGLASKTLVLAERNPGHRLVFPESSIMEFSSIPEFREQLRGAMIQVEYQRMVSRAYEDVHERHIWSARVKQLLGILKNMRRMGEAA
jgi:glycosyltransferase involved in cell wall biosynthesis